MKKEYLKKKKNKKGIYQYKTFEVKKEDYQYQIIEEVKRDSLNEETECKI